MKGNKSLSQLLKENSFNCEFVSKLTRIPLYIVKNTAIKLQPIDNNKDFIPPTVYIDVFSPQLMRAIDKFNFGKHKGNTLANVMKHDKQYLDYLLKNKLIKIDKNCF